MEACNSTEKTFMRDYKMITTLGQGHFAKVKLAIHHDTRTCVAVKILRNTRKRATLIANEISIMKAISHPNIIKLLDVVQTQKTTYLVTEIAQPGELKEHILLRGYLKESEASRLFSQILQAVQHCQDNYICHRDITAKNVLIDSRGNAKLSNFNLARYISPGQKLLGFCGTPVYCAPELFGDEAYDPFPTDIWSLGVLLFLMVAGCLPFEARSFEILREQISSAIFTVPRHVSRNIYNVIVHLLVVNPARRPTIDQIMGCFMLRGREAHSLLGTTSPRTGGHLRDTLYEPEEGIQSRGDQEHIEVIATCPILQPQSPGEHCCHHQANPVKPRQPGTVYQEGDLHTVPGFLRRATEPEPGPSKAQEKKEENYSRQGGRSHTIPATLCCQPKRTHHRHVSHLGCSVTNSQIKENLSHSMIGLCGSLNASSQASLCLKTNSGRPDQNESITHTENCMPSCSIREKLCDMIEDASTKLTPASSGVKWLNMTCMESKTLTQEDNIKWESYIICEKAPKQEQELYTTCEKAPKQEQELYTTCEEAPKQEQESYTTCEEASKQEQELYTTCEEAPKQEQELYTTCEEAPKQEQELYTTCEEAPKQEQELYTTCEEAPKQEQELYTTCEEAPKQEQELYTTCEEAPKQEQELYTTCEEAPKQEQELYTTCEEASKQEQELYTTCEEAPMEAIIPKGVMTAEEAFKQVEAWIEERIASLEKDILQGRNTIQNEIITHEEATTEEEVITHGQPQDSEAASSRPRRRRWKRVKKTIVNGLRRLCCCLPPTERSHASSKNRTPEERDRGVTHRTSPEEDKPQLHGL